jgi:mitochondrial Rho GTPase 1
MKKTVTFEKVPGIIIDYSSREQDESELAIEISKASVVCIVYSVDDDESKKRISSYWLPKIAEAEEATSGASLMSPSSSNDNQMASTAAAVSGVTQLDSNVALISANKRPIVLVANKIDTSDSTFNLLEDKFIATIIASHPQIETCIQCSAKTLKNVPEVFYYAQKSVLYPTSPVYDLEKKKLTSQCIRCLTRIFKLCDQDNDGLLSDNELNEFQLKCFGVRLNTASLQEVKSLLLSGERNTEAEENLRLINNKITLSGFLYLHMLFIRKGRHETTWTVLKKFGYDKNLSIRKDYATIKLAILAIIKKNK